MQNVDVNTGGFWSQKRSIVAIAISMLALAEIIDLTIVAVAIPQIMGSIGANVQTIADVTTTYIVMAAIFILLSGLVISKYGIKRVALISSLVFGVSSILCGTSTSLTEMIIFRAFQGIGGAFLPSLAQTYISANFKGQEYTKMMTVYTMVIVLGPIVGPIIGGAICENLTWPWIFYVNVPLCIVASIIIFFLMENTKINKNIKIDYISFGFMAIGVGCLEFMVDNGNTKGWFQSLEIIILLAISVVSLGFFIWRGAIFSSVVKFRIFKNLNFVISCFLCFTFVLLFSAAMGYFPTMLQNSYHYPVDLAGYITAPRGIAAVITAAVTQGVLVKKIGIRPTISAGMIIFGIACIMQADFSNNVNQLYIISTVILQGIGMMMFFTPFMGIVVIGIAQEDLGDMSGAFNFFRNFGSSVGTAFIATFLSHNQQTTFQTLASNISTLNPNFQHLSNQLHISPEKMAAVAQQTVISQSNLLSYINSYYVVGVVSLILAVIPFFLKKPTDNASPTMAH